MQTAGGALPGAMSRVVREMLASGLLAGHVTAAPAYGGRHEAISTAGGLHAGLTALGWDAAIAGPGPGILGSATALGHGGLVALDSAHAALALGATTVVVPRMSSGDPRAAPPRPLPPHPTVLRLMLRPAIVALPEGESRSFRASTRPRVGAADVDGYVDSGLPARTMGREIEEDDLFFRASLAGGSVLAGAIMSFERIGSKEMWSGRIVAVREDRFRYDDGEEVDARDRRATRASVAIVAHDGEQIYLVAQPREAVDEQELLELPAGKLDEEGESPLDAAKRELAEEIGKGRASGAT